MSDKKMLDKSNPEVGHLRDPFRRAFLVVRLRVIAVRYVLSPVRHATVQAAYATHCKGANADWESCGDNPRLIL
jgi:hypothetical protein